MRELKKRCRPESIARSTWLPGIVIALLLGILFPAPAFASPWGDAVNKLMVEFTGPIARGLSLVALVVGGVTWALDESGGSKRMLAGIFFGIGMAVGATNFLVWFFQ
jgi:type IV secretory pathway VirB2 component (pilin)